MYPRYTLSVYWIRIYKVLKYSTPEQILCWRFRKAQHLNNVQVPFLPLWDSGMANLPYMYNPWSTGTKCFIWRSDTMPNSFFNVKFFSVNMKIFRESREKNVYVFFFGEPELNLSCTLLLTEISKLISFRRTNFFVGLL